MSGRKKSASDSLEKLSRGLTRETPATRAGQAEDGGGEAGPSLSSGGIPADGAPRRRGRPRTRPERMVRVSVDLPRPEHKYLRDFVYDAESDGMRVMRALLQEMRDDEDLAERVLDRLAGAE